MGQLYLFSLGYFLAGQLHTHKALIILIIIGLIAGLLAQMILPGRGFGMLTTIILGIAGAWAGNRFLKPYLTFVGDPLIREVVSAIICTMFFGLVYNIARGGQDRDKTGWRHN